MKPSFLDLENWNSTEQSKFVFPFTSFSMIWSFFDSFKFYDQEVITTFLFERCPPTSCSLQEVNEKFINIFFSKGSGITVSRIPTGRSNEWMGRLKPSFSLWAIIAHTTSPFIRTAQYISLGIQVTVSWF